MRKQKPENINSSETRKSQTIIKIVNILSRWQHHYPKTEAHTRKTARGGVRAKVRACMFLQVCMCLDMYLQRCARTRVREFVAACVRTRVHMHVCAHQTGHLQRRLTSAMAGANSGPWVWATGRDTTGEMLKTPTIDLCVLQAFSSGDSVAIQWRFQWRNQWRINGA